MCMYLNLFTYFKEQPKKKPPPPAPLTYSPQPVYSHKIVEDYDLPANDYDPAPVHDLPHHEEPQVIHNYVPYKAFLNQDIVSGPLDLIEDDPAPEVQPSRHHGNYILILLNKKIFTFYEQSSA